MVDDGWVEIDALQSHLSDLKRLGAKYDDIIDMEKWYPRNTWALILMFRTEIFHFPNTTLAPFKYYFRNLSFIIIHIYLLSHAI